MVIEHPSNAQKWFTIRTFIGVNAFVHTSSMGRAGVHRVDNIIAATTYRYTSSRRPQRTGCMGPYAHLLQPPTLRRAKARTPGRPNLSSICALLWSVRVWPTPRSDTTFHRLSMAGAMRRPLRWHQRTAVPSGAVGRCGSASARQAHIVGILRGASRARRAQGAGVRLRGWTYLQAPR